MRNRFQRVRSILHFTGHLLEVLGLVLILANAFTPEVLETVRIL
jgi:hypothetical protein